MCDESDADWGLYCPDDHDAEPWDEDDFREAWEGAQFDFGVGPRATGWVETRALFEHYEHALSFVDDDRIEVAKRVILDLDDDGDVETMSYLQWIWFVRTMGIESYESTRSAALDVVLANSEWTDLFTQRVDGRWLFDEVLKVVVEFAAG